MPIKTVSISKLSNFFDKQWQATEAADDYKFTLYGGAAGGGKSRWLRWYAVDYLIRKAKETGQYGIRVGLFCEDYPALKDRQLVRIQYEFPTWLGTMNKSDHEFILKPQYGSGVIAFRNLDDPSKYQSAEFALIAIDELTRNPYEVFTFLRTRLRWPGIKDVRFIAGTNPGGIGHAWVKKLWIEKQFEDNEQEKDQFVFVPSKAKDNPYIDKVYVKSLQGLPTDLRKAYLEGDWNIFKGQVFTEWKPSYHITTPDKHPIFPTYDRIICFDYGYRDWGAMYWIAIDYDGMMIVYRELYAKNYTYKDWAGKARDLSGWGKELPEGIEKTEAAYLDLKEESAKEAIKYMVAGKDSFRRNDQTIKSGVDVMRSIFPITYEEAYTDRMQGLAEFHERLKIDPETKQPGIVFYESCENAIRTIPSVTYEESQRQMYDQKAPEGVDTKTEDHAYDAIRGGMMSRRMRKSQIPKTPMERKFESWKLKESIQPETLGDFYANQ